MSLRLRRCLRRCASVSPHASAGLIFATSRDKPAEQMLRQLRTAFDEIVLTNISTIRVRVPIADWRNCSPVNRTMRWHRPASAWPSPPKIHGQDARATKPQVHQIATPIEAWKFVRSRAQPEDLICITGSFFLAAEVRPLLVGTAVPGTGSSL